MPKHLFSSIIASFMALLMVGALATISILQESHLAGLLVSLSGAFIIWRILRSALLITSDPEKTGLKQEIERLNIVCRNVFAQRNHFENEATECAKAKGEANNVIRAIDATLDLPNNAAPIPLARIKEILEKTTEQESHGNMTWWELNRVLNMALAYQDARYVLRYQTRLPASDQPNFARTTNIEVAEWLSNLNAESDFAYLFGEMDEQATVEQRLERMYARGVYVANVNAADNLKRMPEWTITKAPGATI